MAELVNGFMTSTQRLKQGHFKSVWSHFDGLSATHYTCLSAWAAPQSGARRRLEEQWLKRQTGLFQKHLVALPRLTKFSRAGLSVRSGGDGLSATYYTCLSAWAAPQSGACRRLEEQYL